MNSSLRSNAPTLSAALGGMALAGLCIGFNFGPAAMGMGAGLLPAVVLGVALFMLPALYIGGAFLGAAPPLVSFVKAAWLSLGDMGIMLFGLSPAALFLLATSRSSQVPFVVGVLLVASGAVVGVRAFRTRLEVLARGTRTFAAVYLGWSLVALGIGWHLFRQLMTLIVA